MKGRVKFEIQTTETTNRQTDYIVIQVRKLRGRRSGNLNRKKNDYAGGKILYKREGHGTQAETLLTKSHGIRCVVVSGLGGVVVGNRKGFP